VNQETTNRSTKSKNVKNKTFEKARERSFTGHNEAPSKGQNQTKPTSFQSKKTMKNVSDPDGVCYPRGIALCGGHFTQAGMTSSPNWREKGEKTVGYQQGIDQGDTKCGATNAWQGYKEKHLSERRIKNWGRARARSARGWHERSSVELEGGLRSLTALQIQSRKKKEKKKKKKKKTFSRGSCSHFQGKDRGKLQFPERLYTKERTFHCWGPKKESA